jgi:hypothetical protein
MSRSRPNYRRKDAEKRFAHVYEPVEGDRCIYCGMPSDGKIDHQPPVYVLHRFAGGGLTTKKAIREAFGQCKLVPCCTICNMGLGAYHGKDDNDRRREIVDWFLVDERFPEDELILKLGEKLVEDRLAGKRGSEVYEFPGVGRVIYIRALIGQIEGEFTSPESFPDWLKLLQSELAEWLRGAPRRKSQYFLDMANLAGYDLVPDARSDPRGQFE